MTPRWESFWAIPGEPWENLKKIIDPPPFQHGGQQAKKDNLSRAPEGGSSQERKYKIESPLKGVQQVWLVIRWILLPLAVEFIVWLTNSTISRRIFASGAWGRGSPLGPGGPAPLAKSFDRLLSLSNEGWIQQSIGESIEYPTTFNQPIEDLLQ